jgi:hypothetical protein
MSIRNLPRFILFIFFIVSCSNTTPTASRTSSATNVPPTISNTLTPAVEATETALPTDTPTPATIEEITFPADAKWVDITKHFPAESDRTFHLEATQGQILMVAVKHGALYPIAIVGDDGVSLTGRWFNPYWRGVLPTTQGYSITIYNYQYSPSAADLTIRVALSAPGETGQVFTYHKDELGLSFNYPDLFAPMDYPDPNLYLLRDTQQLLSLALVDPTYLDNTNLGEAFLVVITNDTQGPECETGNKRETFNGIDFAHFTAFDAGAGNIYQYHIYQTTYTQKCFQFMVWLHSSNLGNYDPSVNIKAFDEAATLKLFTNILETVVIK